MGPLKSWLLKFTQANFDNLSTLCWIITVLHMSMLWWTFWTDYNPVPIEMAYLLWIVLTAYTTPKEIVRWRGPRVNGHVGKRYGQVFAVLWILSFAAMLFMIFIDPDSYSLPKGMTETVIGVWAIFTVSNTSRKVHKFCRKKDLGEIKEGSDAQPPDTQDSTLR